MKRIIAILITFILLLPLAAYGAEEKAGPVPVRIAVIDTGISDRSIDQSHVAEGYNYILPGESTVDKIGHGTAIASIIVGSEKAGITGLCPEAVLVPLVFYSLDENGKIIKGSTTLLAKIIRDAVDIYHCRILNISSGSLSDTPALAAAVAYAEEQGVMIVSCAGNDGDETVYYPGAYDTVLCVGSANAELTGAAGFSQRNEKVDVLAPGERLPVATIKGKRLAVSGTSFSAAYASATLARLLVEKPGLTPAQMRQILLNTALDLGEAGCGYGLLQPDAALASARAVEEGELNDSRLTQGEEYLWKIIDGGSKDYQWTKVVMIVPDHPSLFTT
jgi:minor extracellular protease Epr